MAENASSSSSLSIRFDLQMAVMGLYSSHFDIPQPNAESQQRCRRPPRHVHGVRPWPLFAGRAHLGTGVWRKAAPIATVQ